MRKERTNLLLSLALCGLAAPLALAQDGGPCAKGDIAFGLSNGDPLLTAELVRGGALQGFWSQEAWIQGFEFDNLGGNSHNAGGNLLATNFGTSTEGGSIWSVSTDGTDNASMVYAFDGTDGTMTRIGGLSVSPDNTKLAQIGYDTGALIILEYAAGDGSGNGTATFFEEVFDNFGATGQTQGTAWLDNDVVIAFLPGFGLGEADLISYDTSNGSFDTLATISDVPGGSAFTDIDYNPLVSPLVYCTYSSFDGATNNTLAIFDPDDSFALVNRVDLGGSAETSRECALGFDNGAPALFISQYSSLIDVIDITSPATLTDDSSVDFYEAGEFAAFNGFDYALTGPDAPSDCISLDVQNLVAGERALFTVSGGTPGVKAVTVYGTAPGSTKVNNVAGYCADFGIKGVNQKKVLGGLNKSFDIDGNITFNIPIPGNASGLNVLFQSAMQGTCPDECVSNLVEQTVQ